MPSPHHELLKWLSAVVWFGGAAVLIWKGFEWLTVAGDTGSPGWPVAVGVAALLVGVIRGRTMFRRACARNLHRIARLDAPRPWLFFRPVFYLALAAMVLAGFLISLLGGTGYAGSVVAGGLDLAIGTSLLLGSTPFWTWSPEAPQPAR